jgi:tripartite-type tricarboxylate transporter receptor subunit TctC
MDTEGNVMRRYVVGLGLALALGASYAQTKAVTKIVVPYPPGGVTDQAARVLVERLSKLLGETFIVDNRPGAGSRLGTQAVAQASSDGTTLLFTNISFSTLPLVDKTVRFDPVTGFAPVGLAAVYGATLVVKPSLPVANLQELVAYAKRRPGQLSYGSAGMGSGSHFVGEYFKALTGTFVVHIPYRSTGAALNDVAGGQIDLAFHAMAKPLIDAGSATRACPMCPPPPRPVSRDLTSTPGSACSPRRARRRS